MKPDDKQAKRDWGHLEQTPSIQSKVCDGNEKKLDEKKAIMCTIGNDIKELNRLGYYTRCSKNRMWVTCQFKTEENTE